MARVIIEDLPVERTLQDSETGDIVGAGGYYHGHWGGGHWGGGHWGGGHWGGHHGGHWGGHHGHGADTMAVIGVGITVDTTAVIMVAVTTVDIMADTTVVITADTAVDITVADAVANRHSATARTGRAESHDSVAPS